MRRRFMAAWMSGTNSAEKRSPRPSGTGPGLASTSPAESKLPRPPRPHEAGSFTAWRWDHPWQPGVRWRRSACAFAGSGYGELPVFEVRFRAALASRREGEQSGEADAVEWPSAVASRVSGKTQAGEQGEGGEEGPSRVETVGSGARRLTTGARPPNRFPTLLQ